MKRAAQSSRGFEPSSCRSRYTVRRVCRHLPSDTMSNVPNLGEEVGKLFAVTRERIRQIEAKAMRKLRTTERLRNGSKPASWHPGAIAAKARFQTATNQQGTSKVARISLPVARFQARRG